MMNVFLFQMRRKNTVLFAYLQMFLHIFSQTLAFLCRNHVGTGVRADEDTGVRIRLDAGVNSVNVWTASNHKIC
jgi:hypothetical protein